MAIPRVDRYASFSELERHETEGRDFRVHLRHGCSGIAVMAPHGGGIERGTLAIADAIAGSDHTYYGFEGIKPILKHNRILHITSDHFDEPRALAAAAGARGVITIHGALGAEPAVYAGGLDLTMRHIVLSALNRLGVVAGDDPSPTRQGRGRTNLCNRGFHGQGLQLEFTFGMRRTMFEPAPTSIPRRLNPYGLMLVDGVRRALRDYLDHIS